MIRHVPLRGACLALAALSLAAVACRKAPEGPADAGVPAAQETAEERLFTMADLAAATRLDARVQRAIALAGEYKLALTFDRGPRLTEHTDQVAKALDDALPTAERALADIRDPRDRALSAPIVAAARRWPAQLLAARAELLSSPHPTHRAADALAATDDEVARALDAYRAFRATWRITDSPAEPEPVLEFLRARRALEGRELEEGRRLQGASAVAPSDQAELRAAVDQAVAGARAAAGKLDGTRKAIAERFVDSEARALLALLGLSTPGAIDEQRERDALAYQIAKVGALEAIADYVALTAKGSPATR